MWLELVNELAARNAAGVASDELFQLFKLQKSGATEWHLGTSYVGMGGAAHRALMDHFVRALRHQQIGKRLHFEPLYTVRIVARAHFASQYCAVKVNQHIVIFAGAGRVWHDALE